MDKDNYNQRETFINVIHQFESEYLRFIFFICVKIRPLNRTYTLKLVSSSFNNHDILISDILNAVDIEYEKNFRKCNVMI